MNTLPGILKLSLLTLICLAALATDPVLASVPGFLGQTPTPQNFIVQRSYWFEITIVVVMVGAALFAVCKSSNRR